MDEEAEVVVELVAGDEGLDGVSADALGVVTAIDMEGDNVAGYKLSSSARIRTAGDVGVTTPLLFFLFLFFVSCV